MVSGGDFGWLRSRRHSFDGREARSALFGLSNGQGFVAIAEWDVRAEGWEHTGQRHLESKFEARTYAAASRPARKIRLVPITEDSSSGRTGLNSLTWTTIGWELLTAGLLIMSHRQSCGVKVRASMCAYANFSYFSLALSKLALAFVALVLVFH